MGTRLLLTSFAAALSLCAGCRTGQVGAPAARPAAGGSLDGTSWLISAVDGDLTPLTGDLLRDNLYAVDFSGDGVLGYGGCNRFSGSYTRRGDLVTFTPTGSTRRACAADVMAREQRLFEILEKPVRIIRPDAQTMLLQNEVGRVTLVRSGGGD
jgi:heat shock protein HslJ